MSCQVKSYVWFGLNWRKMIQCGPQLILCCGWFMCLYLEQGGRAEQVLALLDYCNKLAGVVISEMKFIQLA